MTQINAYDLTCIIGNHFKPSMESEQEIEISTDTVVINQELKVADEVQSVAGDTAAMVETDGQLEDVEEAEASLEALIASMESSILRGGFDRTNASLANITLESIARRFDFDATMLTFGMEAVGDDAEEETKVALGKAKQMLNVLKSYKGGLVGSIYRLAAGAMGNNAALASSILIYANQIKSNIDNSHKGGDVIHLNPTVGRKFGLGTDQPLSPDNYVREFKRAVDKYNMVIKTYADTNMLSNFVEDVVKGMGGAEGQPASVKSIMSAVATLSEDITQVGKGDEKTEVKQSAPYLGGMVISSKRPSLKSVEELLTTAVKKTQVSQEGVGNFIGGMIQVVVGGAIFTMGSIGMFAGSWIAATSLPAIPLSMAGIALATLSFFGARAGARMAVTGFDQQTEQVNKAIDAVAGKFSFAKKFTAVANTDFSVGIPGFGNEAAYVPVKTTTLSPKQITDILGIIQNTAATTNTLKAEFKKRKAIMSKVDAITKEMSKEKDNNGAMQSAAAAFVKQFIKQTIKFEMEMTNYAFQVMRSGILYCAISNSSYERETASKAPDAK